MPRDAWMAGVAGACVDWSCPAGFEGNTFTMGEFEGNKYLFWGERILLPPREAWGCSGIFQKASIPRIKSLSL